MEYKVLANQALDPEGWVENAVGHVVELAKDEMVNLEWLECGKTLIQHK